MTVAVAPTYDWSTPSGGSFNTATNWSGGVVPGYLDDADLVGLGAPYTVTIAPQGTVSLNGLQTAAGTTLEIKKLSSVEVQFGTDGGVSAGVIKLDNDSALLLGGTFTNAGTIALGSTGGIAALGIAGVTLNGGGDVTLSDVRPGRASPYPVANVIAGIGPTYLTNVDNTISGAGDIGAYGLTGGAMTLTNEVQGVIDANGGNALYIDTGATVVNAGLLEATGAGGLVIYDGITNSGTVAATGAGGVAIYGTIANSGTLEALGATQFASLFVGGGGVTLTGGGEVTLNAKGILDGYQPGATLTNVDNTIGGGGFITGPLGLDNQAQGVIDADLGRMLINTGNTVTNEGLIEATGATGILLVSNTTIDSSGGGTVEAARQIQLNGASLLGGAVTIDKGGALLSNTLGGVINLAGGTVTNAGTLEGAGGGLTVDGDIANTGLVIAENASLTITGSVTGAGKIDIFGKGDLEIDGPQGGTIAFAAGSTGVLVLGDSAAFTGTVTGFSKTGVNSLNLKDIAYGAGDAVTFKANANANTGGILTVSDGTNTATIKLAGGNYAKSTFTLAQDSGTGIIVADPAAHAFVASMAGFAPAAGSGGHAGASTSPSIQRLALSAPMT